MAQHASAEPRFDLLESFSHADLTDHTLHQLRWVGIGMYLRWEMTQDHSSSMRVNTLVNSPLNYRATDSQVHTNYKIEFTKKKKSVNLISFFHLGVKQTYIARNCFVEGFPILLDGNCN